ncbi:DUF3829 domain-containing protein [Tardiphaga sp. 709]|uniref:DUF3829 domain-containing protein n=1 Tax=Tardiphaga sp. 709 TaxID=3076039 RepID=UPI0028EA4280|nr:DUF3829 domain-containing protein [Tardiphaga sp. 709]WNV09013.1 DUF3829 domain-containing protein [Tardiphaga sp. 709]
MISFRALAAAASAALTLTSITGAAAATQTATATATEKLNAYVGCVNSLSERTLDSRTRHFSWAPKSAATGKERIVYGLYKISAAV